MCLLSVFMPDTMVNIDHLLAGACSNPDGYGFAIIVDDRIEIGKGMDAFAVVEAFDTVRTRHPESWALFHSRYTTDGVTDEDNCHPFIVGGDERTVLGHNGVLPKSARPRKGDIRSDTRILAESLIPNGHFGRLHRPKGRKALEAWIGSEGYPNKVAILTVDPRYKGNAFILGEERGLWDDGVWHSNTDYIPWTPAPKNNPSMKDPYGAYIRGDISYGDYIDQKYGIRRMDACPQCQRASTVDQTYMYCRACKICLDCEMAISACDCWVPQSEKEKGLGPDETADAISAVAIEEALAKLPAVQAQKVRAALGEGQ